MEDPPPHPSSAQALGPEDGQEQGAQLPHPSLASTSQRGAGHGGGDDAEEGAEDDELDLQARVSGADLIEELKAGWAPP